MDTITRTFPLKLDSTYTPDAILELFHLRDMTFDTDERVAVYLESWFCNLNLKSFQPGIIPEFEGDESEAEKMAKFTAAENKSQKVGLQILDRKNNTGDWDEIAEIILVNRGRKDYFDLLQPYLAKNQVRILEKNDALGIKLIDYGNGLLKLGDKIKITLGITITISKKNDVEALQARISALELALEGKLINLPSNSLLGRNTNNGVVEIVSQTKFATPEMLEQAIIDWVGTAPANLDTLIELGNAINNDANFASTITNALALKAPLTSDGKLALRLDKMPLGNAWGQELPHGNLQTYSWDTTPFGAFFAFRFTGSNFIPNQQYYGLKIALGNNTNLPGYYVQVLISRFTFAIYVQWVENNVISQERQINTTTLF